MNRHLTFTQKRGIIWAALALLSTFLSGPSFASRTPVAHAPPAPAESDLTAFAAELEQIRQNLNIPGMSAAIVQDQQLIWAQGFGYADVEGQLSASVDTPYHLASVTKPIAATLLMQLVEEGKVSLDDPLAQYGIRLPESGATVWHLLTHTSEGTPGTVHEYNGNRYALLDHVVASACGAPFGKCLSERLLAPLGMTQTAPNPAWGRAGWQGTMAAIGIGEHSRNFPQVYRDLARPYQFDTAYHNLPGAYPLFFSPAAGLMASVTDVARFDIALDQDRLLQPETKIQMFTPAVSNTGQELIYGLGWYTQLYEDTRLIWHSGGWSPSVSALYLKVPDENLTFILLANNYNLTRPYPLGDGDVLTSTPALAFYKHFVFPRQSGLVVPAVDWSGDTAQLVTLLAQSTDRSVRAVLERELWSYRKLYASVGESVQAEKLADVHRLAFPDFSRSRLNRTLTRIAGPPPEPQPVSLLPVQVTYLSYLIVGWLLLTAAVLFLLSAKMWQRPQETRLAWLPIILLFGVLGYAAFRICEAPTQGSARWRQALSRALASATGNIIGLFLALLAIYVRYPEVPGALPAIAAMFLTNWLLFQTPLVAREGNRDYVSTLCGALPSAIISTVMVVAGVLPVVVYLTENIFLHVAPNSPLYLPVVWTAAIAGTITVYPYSYFSIRRTRRATHQEPSLAAAK